MFLANVVFPAPSAAYVASLFFPLAGLFGLITEYVVFEKFQREVASAAKLLWVVIAVNLFSWVVGIVLSSLLPGGLVPKLVGDADHPIHILTTGPNWNVIAVLSFFWACLLSFALEYTILRLFARKLHFCNLAVCVALANVASYGVIGIMVAIFIYAGAF